MSKTVMVRYKVKPDQAAVNEALSRRVYKELQRAAPVGLHYATFVLEDGLSFVHVAFNETESDRSPLQDVPAFQEFVRDIDNRCDETPATSILREIDSYQFWNR